MVPSLEPYLPLLRTVARSVSRSNGRACRFHPFDELVNMGVAGLVAAFARYDPARGDFEMYAGWRIKGAILDAVRGNRYNPEFVSIGPGAVPIAANFSPEAMAVRSEFRSIVLAEMADFTRGERVAIARTFFDGFKRGEIATELGVSGGRVSGLVEQGIERFRRHFAGTTIYDWLAPSPAVMKYERRPKERKTS